MDYTQEAICANYPIIYKYLDIEGGKAMLENGNIQFSRSCDLNDPFECFEHLFEYSNPPEGIFRSHYSPEEIQRQMIKNVRRMKTNIGYSSFSKTPDNLLMWSYYNQHQGICIGVKTNIIRTPIIMQRRHFSMREVSYPEQMPKRSFWDNTQAFAKTEHLLCTKSHRWEHEEEIRMITIMDDPKELDDRNKLMVFVHKSSFAELFLGCNIKPESIADIQEIVKRKYTGTKLKVNIMQQDTNNFGLLPVHFSIMGYDG